MRPFIVFKTIRGYAFLVGAGKNWQAKNNDTEETIFFHVFRFLKK